MCRWTGASSEAGIGEVVGLVNGWVAATSNHRVAATNQRAGSAAAVPVPGLILQEAPLQVPIISSSLSGRHAGARLGVAGDHGGPSPGTAGACPAGSCIPSGSCPAVTVSIGTWVPARVAVGIGKLTSRIPLS